MRRALSILTLLALAAPPALAAELCVTGGEYFCCHPLCDLPGPVSARGYSTSGPATCSSYPQFSISSSSTDPDQNQGPIPDQTLYLWLNADPGYGFGSGWLTLGGDLSVADVTPTEPTVSWEPGVEVLGITGCFFESTLIATITIDGTVDIDPTTWGRIKALWK